MSKNITIKDIASRLNLHYTTVSRAIRNHPDVNPETRKRILATAEELNYFPNSFATNLRRKKSNIIGVIVPELQHHFFSSIISEIANIADQYAYSVLVCQTNESLAQEKKLADVLIRNRVAGVLASISEESGESEHLERIIQSGIPLVFFDRVCDSCRSSRVTLDFYEGAYTVVRHLIQMGCRRIAHIAGPIQIEGVKQRFEGYKAALASHQIPVDETLIRSGGFCAENGISATDRFLKLTERPDAIFAVNDEVAIGAMMRIRKAGLNIPEDIAVAGFDDDKMSAYTDPPLTSVRIHQNEVGSAAIALLLEQINARKKELEPVVKMIRTTLIVRESTLKNDFDSELAI